MLAVALALSASLCWGSGDFLGGLTTRRATLWAVILGSQVVGLTGAIAVVILAGRPWIGFAGLWPVLLGSIAGSIALMAFYKALAIGTMSIVAPITATSALVPFAWGIAAGERPGLWQLVGVAVAVAGVLVVTIERPRRDAPAADRATQRRAALLAVVAAAGIGLMLIGYDQTAKHDALWAMLGGRISSACFFAIVLLVLRPRIGLKRAALPGIVAVGIFDTAANGLFSLATTQGYLSIVGVIGSLYPVTTVVLAYVVLRERLERRQLFGVLAALAGVAVIAAR